MPQVPDAKTATKVAQAVVLLVRVVLLVQDVLALAIFHVQVAEVTATEPVLAVQEARSNRERGCTNLFSIIGVR